MHKNIVGQRMDWIAVSSKGYFRPMLVPPLRIPEVSRRNASNCFETLKRVPICLDPGKERLPDFFRLIAVQPMKGHPHLKRVVGPHVNLLSPMVIEEIVVIEADELSDEASIGVI